MASRQVCPKCDEPVPVGARECPECGARLVRRDRRDDEDDDRPRARDRRDSDRPRNKKRPEARPVGRILIPAVAGGVILLAGITVTAVWALGGFAGRGTGGSGGEPRSERPRTAFNDFEPVAWAVPDGAAAVQPFPARITLPQVKAVSFPPGPRRTFLAVQVQVDKSDAYHTAKDTLVAGDLDPATGQPRANVRQLDPKLIVRSRTVPAALPPASVNGAGTLATRGVEPGTVEFHAPDGSKKSARFGNAAIDWLLWTDDSTLLVLTGGQLIGWDVSAGRAGFTVGGPYQLPAAAPPARNWVAVSVAGKYLDVIDAKTGTCRGRIGGEGGWTGLAVSPDAKRLAAVRTTAELVGWTEVHAWDLKTGRRTGVVPSTHVSDDVVLRWADSNRLYLASAEYGLLDMDKNVLLARLTTNVPRRILADGPDGRAWARADLTLKGIAVVAPVEVSLPAGSAVFHPGVGVRVEVDCGDPKLSERATATLNDILKEAGYPTGGDWAVRLRAAEHDSGKALTVRGSEVKVPGVKGTFELVAPDGKVVGTTVYSAAFPETASQYFIKSKHDQFVPGGPGAGRTDLYNFGGRDPRKAMVEETWDRFLKGLDTAPIPRGAWRTPTGYNPLPMNNTEFTSPLN